MHVLSLTPLLPLISTALASPVLSPDRQTALYSSSDTYNTSFLADLSLEDAFPAPGFFDTVSPALFDDFVRYTKYSSAAYIPSILCRWPLGNTRVLSFSRGAHGFIARDDARSEIVLTFRGTLTPRDVLTDLRAYMVALKSFPAVRVHKGFLTSFKSVARKVLAAVAAEHQEYPTYTIIVTGHSLGGALASLAAPTLKAKLPSADIKLYTFGQPRVGNAEFAALVEKVVGVDNIFRVVHTNDGVPMVPIGILSAGRYQHFATEYWQFKNPTKDDATPHATVRKCTGGEDMECSNSFGWKRVLWGHTRYFGQKMARDVGLCFGE
ncbi:Alpha/Beta hydrolase protein [Mycena filopes]|nr:Alpha/Beta hydrolase protein [Mycena filopes]